MTVLVDADACPVKRIIVEEARRRGLLNLPTTVDALPY